ncbi:MAG: hypothetical protein H6917_16015 [Novosphingobium sp.]|nr:hypothetical protein [Novosphingobium sp.]MCP5403877.1 hypothetical protein [Novosphingobium sp.]
MASTVLRGEERIGLIVAAAAHIALLVLLVVRPPGGESVIPPQRIEVTLTDEVGLTSTSPEPFEDAAPDVAPQLGEAALPEATPTLPDARADSRTALDDIIGRSEPQATPPPRPAPRSVSRPPSRPAARPAPSRPAPRAAPAPRPSARTGGSRIGNDFLEGVPGAQTSGRSTSPRAAEIGPSVRSALAGAISRQLKPHWSAPQGPDAEELVTILAWNLNSDGSLDGTPRVVRQLGVNDVNRAQAGRHAEQAIRAVQLAAPFNLPSEYYDGWKRISAFRFDKRLSL